MDVERPDGTNTAFETPPPPRGGSEPSIVERLAVLRENPGEWTRVHGPTTRGAAKSWANNLRRGVYSGCPKGHYEAVSRTVDGQSVVWARYVGNEVDQ